MKEKRKWEEGYPCLLFFMLSSAAIFLYKKFFIPDTMNVFLFVIVILYTGIYLLCRIEKKKFLLGFITIILTGSILLAVFKKWKELTIYLSELFQKAIIPNDSTIVFDIKEQIIIYSIILFSMIFFLELLMLIYQLRYITAVVMIIGIVYAILERKEIGKFTTIFLIGFILLILMELVQSKNKKITKVEQRKAIVFMAPFFLIMIIILLLFPEYQKPYEWTFISSAKETIHKESKIIYQRIKYIFEQSEWNGKIGESGYSDSGFLGNGVSEGEKVDMVLTLKKPINSPLYLTGTEYSDFNHMEWQHSSSITEEEKILLQFNEDIEDTEWRYAAYRYGEEHIGELFCSGNCYITFKEMYTDTIFHPLATTDLFDETIRLDYKKKETKICFKSKLGFEDDYQVYYLLPNQGNPLFEDFLKSEIGYRYNKNGTQNEENFFIATGILKSQQKRTYEETLSRKVKAIQSVYGKKPDFSPAIQEYVNHITAGCTTDYEKLKAIETELSSYQYKTDMKLDSKRDFLEQFLLENKAGYCTYYATAFVLMSRYIGVPARYVQGYCVPTCNYKEIEVMSTDAHAWPEVYFEGVGWIAFEPTPGYQDKRYAVLPVNSGAQPIVKVTPMIPQQQQFFEDTTPSQQQDNEEVKINKMIMVIIVISVIFVFCMAYVISGKIRKKRYQKMSGIEKVAANLQLMMQLFAYHHYKIAEGETLQEFFDRMKNESYGNLLDIPLEIYQKTRYKEEVPNNKDIIQMQNSVNEIYKLIYLSLNRKNKLLIRIKLHDFSLKEEKQHLF